MGGQILDTIIFVEQFKGKLDILESIRKRISAYQAIMYLLKQNEIDDDDLLKLALEGKAELFKTRLLSLTGQHQLLSLTELRRIARSEGINPWLPKHVLIQEIRRSKDASSTRNHPTT